MNDREALEQFFELHKEQFVEHIRQLIAIKSVKGEAKPGIPFGEGPAKALHEALNIAESLGLLTNNVDEYAGTISINEHETKLGILAHVDVVGEGANWSMDPYAGIVKDGMLFGRGSSDDKGPAIAAMYALAAVKQLGVPLKYNAKLILGTDEESGCEDIEYYFKKEPAPPYVFTPDAEFPVINIEKGAIRTSFHGRFQQDNTLPKIVSIQGGYKVNVVPPEAAAIIEGLSRQDVLPFIEKTAEETKAKFEVSEQDNRTIITAEGIGAHASIPETGVNAITAMLTLLNMLPIAESEGYRKLQGIHSIFPHGDHEAAAAGLAMSDEESGALTMNLAIIDYDESGVKCQFDSRIPLCATEENTFDVLAAKLAPYELELERSGYEKPHHTPADSPFVQTLLSVYEQYTGLKGECLYTGGGTYVHDIEGGVAFGPTMPGIDTRMHSSDEFIIIDDMIQASKIYAQVIIEMCGEQSTF